MPRVKSGHSKPITESARRVVPFDDALRKILGAKPQPKKAKKRSKK